MHVNFESFWQVCSCFPYLDKNENFEWARVEEAAVLVGVGGFHISGRFLDVCMYSGSKSKLWLALFVFLN